MEEKNTIGFEYSANGVPIITLGDLGNFIFSKITSHPEKGFKYLCFSHSYDDVVVIKQKNGERSTFIVPTNDSFVVNMSLERKPETENAKAYGLPHGVLPSRMKDFLKKIIKPYIENGYIHFSDIKSLKKKLEGKDIENILGKIQKKRKKRKPKEKK